MKTWNYNGIDYRMEKVGYGTYTINGHITHDSIIYDYVDDDEDEEKQNEARQDAERFLRGIDEVRFEFLKKGGEDFASCFEFSSDSCWVVEAKGCLTDETFDYVTNEIRYSSGTEKFDSQEEAIERLFEIYSMND